MSLTPTNRLRWCRRHELLPDDDMIEVRVLQQLWVRPECEVERFAARGRVVPKEEWVDVPEEWDV